jgi:cytochrome P450
MDKSLDSLSFFFPSVPFPNQYNRDWARKRIDVIFKKIIAKRREQPAEQLGEEPDLIAVLMGAVLEDGTKLTDDHIVGM